MNGNRKFKSLRLVRFGEVLYDQQRRLIMLCRSCQKHYLSLEAFQAHLIKCGAVKHIVTSIDELQYDEKRRESRLINGKQEMFIYEPDAVLNGAECIIDWEAELEDPRWYTDDNRTLQTKTKQTPTNSKENVVETRIRNQAAISDEMDIQNLKQAPKKPQRQTQLDQPPPAKRMRQSAPTRTILTSQKQQHITRASLDVPKAKNDVYMVKNIIEDLRGLNELATARAVSPATTTTTLACTKTTEATIKPTVVDSSANGDTQQILNKLRACGVEVKLCNTRETLDASSADAAALAKKQQALDIMRKLQSNGIQCTKLNNTRKGI